MEWLTAVDDQAPSHALRNALAAASGSGAAHTAETTATPAPPALLIDAMSRLPMPPMATQGTRVAAASAEKPCMPRAGGWSGLVEVSLMTPTPR